jgi:hypothetical protein
MMTDREKHSIEVRAAKQFVASQYATLGYALRNLAEKNRAASPSLIEDAERMLSIGVAWERESQEIING